RGCSVFADEQKAAVSLLPALAAKLRRLVSAPIGLDDVPAAYQALLDGNAPSLKTIIKPYARRSRRRRPSAPAAFHPDPTAAPVIPVAGTPVAVLAGAAPAPIAGRPDPPVRSGGHRRNRFIARRRRPDSNEHIGIGGRRQRRHRAGESAGEQQSTRQF